MDERSLTSDGRADASVRFVTLGCKVNQAESDQIARALVGQGLSVSDGVSSEVVVVNTCTVTAEADAKARKAIRRALGQPGAPHVVVTGCLAAVDPEGVAALGERAVVEPDKALVADRVRDLVPGHAEGRAAVAPERRARVQVKVQDGCDAFCSYCIVPYARGGPRPVPVAEVVNEVERHAADGVGEVVLTGINIGRYDDDGVLLADLVEQVLAAGEFRVRLSSIEPDDVTRRLLDVAHHPRMARHLHLPLQAGCDATLRAMGRRYDTAGYAEVVDRVRSALPGVAITTDLLTGFPGETDEDFDRTLRFVEAMGFARLHVFRFSARPGTVAAGMPDQVSPEVRSARSERARALGDVLAGRWASSMVGSVADVLVERVGVESGVGTSAEYLKVLFTLPAGASVRVGSIVRVLLTGTSDATVTGVLSL